MPRNLTERFQTAKQKAGKRRAVRATVASSVTRALRLHGRGASSKETGFVDTAVATYNYSTTGSIALLNTVAQGVTVNQRVGKKIMLKGMLCRGLNLNNATALINDCAMIIVYDKRPTGALPAITDVLVSASSQSMNNDANSGRFKILKRHDFTLVGNTSQTAPPVSDGNITERVCNDEDWWLNLKGLPTTYKAATTGAIADIEEGALYIVTVGSNVAGTAAAIASLGFRLRFLDI